MIHFCTMMNHTALPAAAPTRTSIVRQANRRTGAGEVGPREKLARIIARYAPAARPLTGNTPAIVDHRLLSTWSHELPAPQPTTDPPTTECQPRYPLSANARALNAVINQRHQGHARPEPVISLLEINVPSI
jgi:hypothetical protein